jgi:hypothetical protein
MKTEELDAWRARTMSVRTLERCDHCSTLQEGVEHRTQKNYWPTWEVNLKSCPGCFEAAKKKAADDAYAGSVCC